MDAAKKIIAMALGAGLLVLFAALFAPSAIAAGPQPYPVTSTSPSLGVDGTSSSAPRPVASTTGGGGASRGTGGQSAGTSGLSTTGVAVFSITGLGLALLVGGSVLLFGGRRKHAHR